MAKPDITNWHLQLQPTSYFKCALLVLMLSVEYIINAYETAGFRSFIDEVLRNDKKLCFS